MSNLTYQDIAKMVIQLDKDISILYEAMAGLEVPEDVYERPPETIPEKVRNLVGVFINWRTGCC